MKTVSKKLISLLLIALLLVSAVPFQAFAVAHDSSHTLSAWQNDNTSHWQLCTTTGCDEAGVRRNEATHTGNPCTVCGASYTVPHDPGTHTLSGWVSGPAGHWKTCTVTGCAPAGQQYEYAAHDGLTCSVCGYVTTYPHSAAHTVSVWSMDGVNHWRVCQTPGCDTAGAPIDTTAHTYLDAGNGVCTVCAYEHTGCTEVDRPGTGVAATCYQQGRTPDKWCSVCHKLISTGTVIPATGIHTFVGGHCTTPGCPATEVGTPYILTLDVTKDVEGNAVADATVAGGPNKGVSVRQNSPITDLPDPVRPGFSFAGWYVGATQIFLGQNYTIGSDAVAYPKWTAQTFNLTVRRTLNGDLSTATTLLSVNLPVGTPLLDYLNVNVKATVLAQEALEPGYKWADGLWRDFAGMMPLTSQLDTMNQARTIYVNFTSTGHVLYFNANGGTVNPTSKGVTFGQPVGTLPVPVKSGSVFQGWKDGSGNLYTAATVYNVNGDTSLEAVWNDEALVILRIYLNGNTSQVNRMVTMDQFVVGNNISRADVVNVVCQYYTPMSGYSLQVAGLFDDNSWPSFCGNMYLGGVDNIQVTNGHLTNIYVMVRNANATNGTIVYNNGYTYGYNNGVYTIGTGTYNYVYNYGTGTYAINGVTYYGSNPKTGDTSYIEAAVTVLVMSASALAVLLYLNSRKKRAC